MVVLAASVVAGTLPAALATAPAGAVAPKPAASAAPGRTVTLISGDRVTLLGASGDKVSVQQGAGRTGVRFLTQRAGGHLFVIPSDAMGLIQAGRLDRRLFDVTTLVKFGYDDRRADIPLIITYADGDRAKAAGAMAGARAGRDLPSVRGQSVKASKHDAGIFWRGLTGGATAARTLGDGASKVWLDGVRQPSLDESVPQIGAPAAWAAGFTGTGVKVAVLDTGIDATHPDLASQVIAQKNFTEDPSNLDVIGHGTHVASTIAGTGAASGGQFKGVASGARLLDGKVCESIGCTESAILAGMEWGATNAKVINMSLGGQDTPAIDPLEEAVSTLTAQFGTLFVIAAGNSGPGAGSVESPGSADAALTVGAVDKSDVMADFSSRGPRVGDGAIKPDLTAPGVDITAARSKDGVFGSPGERYTELSGTSMATPHMAGSVAILAQQHPTWTPAQLKSALMGSTKAIASAGVFDQGAGRVDLTRAITQTVTTTPASISLGRQQWPHGDDLPVTKTVSYHNYGTTALTLKLALTTTGPGGQPTPAGMFTLDNTTLSVPAGGDATASVTADTSVAGPDGPAGGSLIATAGALTVRTPVAVDKEVESYNLTLRHTDRAGHVPADYFTLLFNPTLGLIFVSEPDGTVTVRLPKGKYLLESGIVTGAANPANSTFTQLVQPVVNVSRNQTVSLDARAGKLVKITVPSASARHLLLDTGYTIIFDDGSGLSSSLLSDGGIYTAQVGGTKPVPGFVATASDFWTDRGNRVTYSLFWYQRGRFWTGLLRDVVENSLATVRADYARNAVGAEGLKFTFGSPPGPPIGGLAVATPFKLPFTRTEYYNTDGGVLWESVFNEELPPPSPDEFPTTLGAARSPRVGYPPGQVTHERWNQGVFGPGFPEPPFPGRWVNRLGDDITVTIPLHSDGAGREGFRYVDIGSTMLYRNGTKVGASEEPGLADFAVPAGAANYRLMVNSTSAAPFRLSTRVTCAWTFRSRHVSGDTPALLPLSAVQFAPKLNLDNAAPAGRKFSVPVTVQRQQGAPAASTKTLAVKVSYDDGKTWQPVKLVKGSGGWTAELTHPAKPGFVSLRARAVDSAGNSVEQTIIRAYALVQGG